MPRVASCVAATYDTYSSLFAPKQTLMLFSGSHNIQYPLAMDPKITDSPMFMRHMLALITITGNYIK